MKPVSTAEAPAAIGPYQQAIVAGGHVWCSGQIPLDPAGNLVAGTMEEETTRCLTNLDAVLNAAGTTRAHVVKTTVFLRDMADFPGMNTAYAAFFGPHRPARSTVAVAGLPKGVRVEIDCIAVVG